MSETENVEVTLKKPVTHDGKTIDKLTFREAELGDLAATDAAEGGIAKTILLIAALSETTEGVVRKIKASDLDEILAKIEPLVGSFFTQNA